MPNRVGQTVNGISGIGIMIAQHLLGGGRRPGNSSIGVNADEPQGKLFDDVAMPFIVSRVDSIPGAAVEISLQNMGAKQVEDVAIPPGVSSAGAVEGDPDHEARAADHSDRKLVEKAAGFEDLAIESGRSELLRGEEVGNGLG